MIIRKSLKFITSICVGIITKIWGEPMVGMKWKGYRLKTLQDDIDNGDAVLLEDDDLVDRIIFYFF